MSVRAAFIIAGIAGLLFGVVAYICGRIQGQDNADKAFYKQGRDDGYSEALKDHGPAIELWRACDTANEEFRKP